MEPSPSADRSAGPHDSAGPDGSAELGARDAAVLLDIAESTISSALRGEAPALPDRSELPSTVLTRRGAFVTLEVGGRLNGCIGSIEGVEPLVDSIARLALSAAFDDPRLPPLRSVDLPALTIGLSLLSPLRPLPVDGRDELLGALDPGRDGLLVEHRTGRAVFLPQVWEQLPTADEFVDALWHKAGFAPGSWPPGLRSFVFGVEHHGRAVAA